MATTGWQSQLRGRLSALIFGSLIALNAGSITAAPKDVSHVSGSLETVAPSGYAPVKGDIFFLLSDTTWGSEDIARVRLEVPGAAQSEELARYGGVDMVVYRVPDPLTFLKQQKNLHRPEVKGAYRGDGLANTLSYLWDTWYKQSRRSWQRILSFNMRKAATDEQPQLKMGNTINQGTRFENPNPFKPLEGYELLSQFRYPLTRAQSIKPPEGTKLPGSSSEFMPVSRGNVMVPLGKLKPGLYLVEAIVGSTRANTLVFVSNTQAITKASGKQLLVWTADRRSSKPVANAQVMWTDGAGTLASSSTDADGIAQLNHSSPERSYLIGTDKEGGVFVSENFYYDSEIYNTKLYAFTDRPLYRPGDEVMLKIMGREFTDARNSKTAQDADIDLSVFDPTGTALFTRKLSFKGDSGTDMRFKLPEGTPAGGYDIRFNYKGDVYGAAFRVAEYIKPHFDINLLMDKPELHTNEPITGKIKLSYPDGKPVVNAKLSLNVRAQQITMVDGEMQYAGQFPVKLEQQELTSDSNGMASLKLPAATDPSRYAVTVFASDGAAYRVRITREFLVERGSNPWRVASPRHFTPANEEVGFTLTALGEGGNSPAKWEALRLESREKTEGTIASGATDKQKFSIKFTKPGSYTVTAKDANGNVLGATSHWVMGEGLQVVPGSVEIVLDHDRYNPGDTAEALITFPVPVNDALLTLERDSVEQYALLSHAGDWVQLTKVSPNQWKARIPVRDTFSPNITFSVLYTQGNDYVFANAGIVVAQPALQLDIKPEKATYQPGETVNIDITSQLNGQAAPAQLTVSVVDEMVYVLQPEIAPNIADFFYHPRRNNVRTAASLSFITYDMARSYLRNAPQANRYNERGVKVLERPRRDETDTAAWQPKLMTDANGRARISFTMPDSLTRWRITVRAMNTQGVVGQRTQYVVSDKPVYVKWTGPKRFRSDDQPIVDLVMFNRGQQPRNAELVLNGAGIDLRKSVSLNPGPNYFSLPVKAVQSGQLNAELLLDGKRADALATQIEASPANWLAQQQMLVTLQDKNTPISLPPGAKNLRVSFTTSAAQNFMQVADDLIDYPWGCVEQTASRLIPLSLAYQASPDVANANIMSQPLAQVLQTQRQRLVALAGPNAVFGWWGDTSKESLFLTGYAYYADWYASRALGVGLPASHWENLLELYRKKSAEEPVLHRALLLWWMKQMGLPVQTLLQGVEADLDSVKENNTSLQGNDSVVMAGPNGAVGIQMAELVVGQLRRELSQAPRPALAETVAALHDNKNPMVQSLLLMLNQAPEGVTADSVLKAVSPEYPTFERAMTLVWLQRSVGSTPTALAYNLQPEGWQGRKTLSGRTVWSWPNKGNLPTSLQVKEAPTSGGAMAVLRYDIDAPETQKLPVKVTRRLYVLVPDNTKSAANDDSNGNTQGMQFQAKLVDANSKLRSDQLYVDEIELEPQGGTTATYGLLEVPLPPGADIEGTTWGMIIKGFDGDKFEPFKRPAWQMGALSYGMPVESLSKKTTVRQLVRFSSRGQFALPPVRFYRMYQPNDKAFQDNGKGWKLNVE